MLFTEGMKTHLLFKYYSNQQYQDLHGIQPTYQYLHDEVPSACVPVGLSRVVVLKPGLQLSQAWLGLGSMCTLTCLGLAKYM